MADARVAGLDGQTRSARSVLAGADRASGERARRRRRTTPLLPAEPSSSEPSSSEPSSGPDLGPTSATVIQAAEAPDLAAAASSPQPPGRQSPAKKAPARKAAVKKTAVKKAPAKKAPAKNTVVERTVVEKTAVKKAPSKRLAASPLSAVPSPPPIPVPPVRPRPVFEVDEPLPAGGRHSVALAIAAQIGEALLEAVVSRAKPADIEAKVSSLLSFARRRITGEYELDEFGFDAEFTEAIPLALLKPLYKYWFRVEVRGIENIPAEGGALVVANHSGTIPLDAVMTAVAVHDQHPQHRFLRALGADLVFQTPFLAGLARRAGATLASNPDAERLLSTGHLVGVWPEGFKGIGKPFSERYKLQRFGRGGFVSAALRTGTPIIPCSIVGAEEIYPIIGDIPALARLLGFPYVPITPSFPLLGPLGVIPLPSKWLIEFGPPVETKEYGKPAADDPMLVFDLTDQVRQSIQQTLYSLLVQRRSIFF